MGRQCVAVALLQDRARPASLSRMATRLTRRVRRASYLGPRCGLCLSCWERTPLPSRLGIWYQGHVEDLTPATDLTEPEVPPDAAAAVKASATHDSITALAGHIPGMPNEDATHRRVLSWIYGLVICAAVLAAASGLGSAWEVALYVGSSMIVYWSAESYASVLATRTVTKEPTSWKQIRDVLSEGWVLVTASFVPTAILLVSAYVLGMNVEIAIDLALGACVLLLFGAGWTAALRSGVRGTGHLIVASSVAAAFGLAMAALKYATH